MGIINTCAVYMIFVLASATAKVTLPLPPCTMQERSLLFNKCLFNFGLAHFPDLALMRNSQTCLKDKLQCSAAKDVVVCLNNLKPHAVRNTCRQGLIPTLDYMLTEYNFNCLFKDLETKCWTAIPMLNITAW